MGTYTIEKDPTRDAGLRVLMGPFKVYDARQRRGRGRTAGAEAEGAPVVAEPGQEAEHGAAAQVPGHPGL